MKHYEEITAALFRRREEYEKKKKRQRLLLTRAGVMMAACVLVTVLGLQPLALPDGNASLPNYGSLPNGNPSSNRVPNASQPNSDQLDGPNGNQQGNMNVQIPDDDEQSVIDPDDDSAIGNWKGKAVTGQMLEWLQSAAAEDTLPLVWAKPGIDMSYVYQGKTLQEYWDASEEERTLPERMAALYKLGDYLKYGEALYTTGTPEGEKWAEELYWEEVEYIGQELLDQYVIEGVFYKEKLWNVLQEHDFLYVTQAQWSNALDAYRENICSDTKGVLLQKGLEAYHPGNYVGVANITKAQFEALDAEYFAGWTFGMGEDPNAPQDVTDTDDLIADSGFSSDSSKQPSGLTPDSSKQPEVSADDEKNGVGFDDATRGNQP